MAYDGVWSIRDKLMTLAGGELECEETTKGLETRPAEVSRRGNKCGTDNERTSDWRVLDSWKKWTDCVLYHAGKCVGVRDTSEDESCFCQRNTPVNYLCDWEPIFNVLDDDPLVKVIMNDLILRWGMRRTERYVHSDSRRDDEWDLEEGHFHKERSTFSVTFIESIAVYGRAGESHIQKVTCMCCHWSARLIQVARRLLIPILIGADVLYPHQVTTLIILRKSDWSICLNVLARAVRV